MAGQGIDDLSWDDIELSVEAIHSFIELYQGKELGDLSNDEKEPIAKKLSHYQSIYFSLGISDDSEIVKGLNLIASNLNYQNDEVANLHTEKTTSNTGAATSSAVENNEEEPEETVAYAIDPSDDEASTRSFASSQVSDQTEHLDSGSDYLQFNTALDAHSVLTNDAPEARTHAMPDQPLDFAPQMPDENALSDATPLTQAHAPLPQPPFPVDNNERASLPSARSVSNSVTANATANNGAAPPQAATPNLTTAGAPTPAPSNSNVITPAEAPLTISTKAAPINTPAKAFLDNLYRVFVAANQNHQTTKISLDHSADHVFYFDPASELNADSTVFSSATSSSIAQLSTADLRKSLREGNGINHPAQMTYNAKDDSLALDLTGHSVQDKEAAIYFAINSMVEAAALTANGKPIEISFANLPQNTKSIARVFADVIKNNKNFDIRSINLSQAQPDRADAFKAELKKIAAKHKQSAAEGVDLNDSGDVEAERSLSNKLERLLAAQPAIQINAEPASSTPFANQNKKRGEANATTSSPSTAPNA